MTRSAVNVEPDRGWTTSCGGVGSVSGSGVLAVPAGRTAGGWGRHLGAGRLELQLVLQKLGPTKKREKRKKFSTLKHPYVKL